MAREYGYGQSQSQEPMVWDRVEWRQGLWDRAERRPTTPGGGSTHDMMQQPPLSATGAAGGGYRPRGEPQEARRALGYTDSEAMAPVGASRPIPFGTDRD